jgi:fructose 1,6-bisphosphate aldolase/phosphatase
MKTTLSIIKADIGSIGGHIRPSQRLIDEVRNHVSSKGKGILTDFFISHTGDDIAILFSHSLGKGNEKIHQLAWDAFVAGTKVAKEQGLYGAGQDFLKDSFSGNVKGMGPAVAELEFEERPNEPFLFFAADKTDPGTYNLPLYLAFADPFDHPYWDWVRNKVAQKATDIRQQGFSGAAMLPYAELEYGGIVEKMGILDKKFKIRK